jgi:hypothetical protein
MDEKTEEWPCEDSGEVKVGLRTRLLECQIKRTQYEKSRIGNWWMRPVSDSGGKGVYWEVFKRFLYIIL